MNYRRCETAEAEIGMKCYLSGSEGTGGRIKAEPEDFVVKEISIRPPIKEGGKYTIAELTSNNWETNRLVRVLSRSLAISRCKIGFAGTKDKRAVTTQLVSFECEPSRIDNVHLKDVTIENPYTSNRPIQIGDLIGNSFEITVKDCNDFSKAKESVEETLESLEPIGGFPNYFGVQRFGTIRPVTHKVGEAIVRGDFEKAVKIYLTAQSPYEQKDATEARKKLEENEGNYGKILNELPKTFGYEISLAQHLISQPDDFVGALANMPPNLQMMFTHAYQSYLFNLMLSKRIEKGISLNEPIEGDIVVPLNSDGVPDHDHYVLTTSKNIDLVRKQVKNKRAFVSIVLYGYESEFSEGEMGEIERKVIEDEKIEKKNFMVTGLQNCTSKGSRREIVCPYSDFSYSFGKEHYKVKFSLTKGNYATCLMREFMKSEMNCY